MRISHKYIRSCQMAVMRNGSHCFTHSLLVYLSLLHPFIIIAYTDSMYTYIYFFLIICAISFVTKLFHEMNVKLIRFYMMKISISDEYFVLTGYGFRQLILIYCLLMNQFLNAIPYIHFVSN